MKSAILKMTVKVNTNLSLMAQHFFYFMCKAFYVIINLIIMREFEKHQFTDIFSSIEKISNQKYI